MSVSPIVYRENVEVPYPETPHPLGARLSHDVRDLMMTDVVDLPDLDALPMFRYYGMYDSGDSVDPRSIIQNTPLDQGHCHAENDRTHADPLGCGHCVGYAMKHVLLAYPIVNRAPTLSGSDIYFRAQRLDEWSGMNYQGTSLRAGLKALQSYGYAGTYVFTGSTETVAQWLLSNRGPVTVATNWYQQMFYPKDHNNFLVPTGSLAGGHCWLIDGVNRDTRVFRMINSWGRYWGVNGRSWIRWNDLQSLFDKGPNPAASVVEFLKA